MILYPAFKKGYVTSINCKAGKIALRTYVPLKTRSHLASSWVDWIYQDCLQTDNEPYEGDHKPADEQTVDTAQHFASSSNTAGPCFHSCKRKTCKAEERLSSIDKLLYSEPCNCRKETNASNSFYLLLKYTNIISRPWSYTESRLFESLPGSANLHITTHLRLELTPVEEMILWTAGGTLRSQLT